MDREPRAASPQALPTPARDSRCLTGDLAAALYSAQEIAGKTTNAGLFLSTVGVGASAVGIPEIGAPLVAGGLSLAAVGNTTDMLATTLLAAQGDPRGPLREWWWRPMIDRFLKRFRAASAWARAQHLSASGRHSEALELVRSVEPPPHMRTPWRLFEIHQMSLLGCHQETLRAAISLIDEIAARPRLTPDGRYFVCFAQWSGALAFSKLFPATERPAKLQFDFASVSLEDVSPRWKRKFPLHIHPRWHG